MKHSQEHIEYLDYTKRPDSIKIAIDFAFEAICNNNSSLWGLHNGMDNYNMFGVSEDYFLQSLINGNKNQKEFYVLEVGAGNFQFGKHQVQFINQQVKVGVLPENITINIISIRGEKNNQKSYSQDGNCYLWELGSFKVENLVEEFRDRNFGDLKFDFVVSRYTLMHLADPLGTFIQIHNLVKEGGIILTDTFNLEIQGENPYIGTKILLSYLHETGDKLLVRNGSIFPIIVVEKHSKGLKLPFNYDEIVGHRGYCKILTINKLNKIPLSPIYELLDDDPKKCIGHKELFVKLTNALLVEKSAKLLKKQKYLSDETLLRDRYQCDKKTYDSFKKYYQNQKEDVELLNKHVQFLQDNKHLKDDGKEYFGCMIYQLIPDFDDTVDLTGDADTCEFEN